MWGLLDDGVLGCGEKWEGELELGGGWGGEDGGVGGKDDVVGGRCVLWDGGDLCDCVGIGDLGKDEEGGGGY